MQIMLVLTALVAVSTATGLLWRARQGRVRVSTARAAAQRVDGVELGRRATLLQLSSEYCAPCKTTARVLDDLSTGDIRHVEVDIVDRPDLVSRFNVLQTPTTLILDAQGAVLGRIGGAVRRETIVGELDRLLLVAA